MKYILLLSLLFTAACNSTADFVDCIDGCTTEVGPPGKDGVDGEPAFVGESSITLTASRKYSPSSEMVGDVKAAPAGIYTLPLTVTTTTGNAGNGWLTIMLDGVMFCYQGVSPNTSTLSNQFTLRGIKTTGNCGTGGAIPFANTLTLFDPSDVLITINGGGCGSNCNDVSLSAAVKVKLFNE